jgi:hypothetical protein
MTLARSEASADPFYPPFADPLIRPTPRRLDNPKLNDGVRAPAAPRHLRPAGPCFMVCRGGMT